MKLTKKLIDAAKHPATGQRFLRDNELRGFALRISPGVKTFILEKEIHGRVRRVTLGRYGALTLDQAKDLARKKIGEIADGKDPAEQRQAQRQSATFGDLERMYLARHAVHKKSANNDVSMLKNYLADWRSRRLTAITQADCADLHAAIGATTPTAANRVMSLVRAMFNLAQDWGLHPGPNPASRIKRYREVPRERFVTPDELPKLWAALQNEPNPFVRGAFFVGLLTGARRSEVLSMQWADLDVSQCRWRIPDTKSKRSHYLPLPTLVIDELLRLPRLEGNPHVFAGRWGRKHLVNVSKPWARIRKEAGLDDVRIHDLRRTLGSWLVAAGASLPLIGKALNHSNPATTAVYARLQLGPVRAALDSNAAQMLSVVEKAQQKNS